MKKAHELRDMPMEELESLLKEKSEELMNARIQLNMRALDNPLQVRNMRREIAVINTVIIPGSASMPGFLPGSLPMRLSSMPAATMPA